MKSIVVILIALALFVMCVPVIAQDDAPEPVAVEEPASPPSPPPAVDMPMPPPAAQIAPPPAPMPTAPKPSSVARPVFPGASNTFINSRLRQVVVGPVDSKTPVKRIRGKITVTAITPPTIKMASVEFFFNAALIGQTSDKPYKVEFNADTVSPGMHMLKAVGLDAGGKHVWTASTAVEVPGVSGAQPPAVKIPTRTVKAPGVAPRLLPSINKPAATSKPASPIVKNASGLGKAFASAKNHFTVRYPAGWTVKDQSVAMRPKKAGNMWFAFAPSGKISSLAVNVRRMRVDPTTTADVFAKYNPYVSTWERKDVIGSPAFATTSVTPNSKKVTHRLIFIKNGYAWMLNCIDNSGDSPDKSQQLFDSVVASLVIKGSQPAKAVSVTEKSKKL